MKKLIWMIACTLVIVTGCKPEKRKNIELLIDDSGSVTDATRANFVNMIAQNILPYIGIKDKLTVKFVDRCSESKAEIVYTVDLADQTFTRKSDGINHTKDSLNSRFSHYILDSIKNQIATAIFTKSKERQGCGNYTDIISALNECHELIDSRKSYKNQTDEIMNSIEGHENYAYETSIFIFSDMINEDPESTLNMTNFGRLAKDKVIDQIAALKSAGKIADFTGVKIIINGATSSNGAGLLASKQIENIRYFWKMYFREGHADLLGYGYDSRPAIKTYLTAN